MQNRRNLLAEARRNRENSTAYIARQLFQKELAEQNELIRAAIDGRPNWSWVNRHGGYAHYNYGIRQIGIVKADRDNLHVFDAEKINFPQNDKIMYGATDVNVIIAAVEQHFAK